MIHSLLEMGHLLLMLKAQLHFTRGESQLEDRVLGGGNEKDSLIALPGKGTQWANALKPCVPTWGRIVRSFIVVVQRGCGQSVDIFLTGWW